MISALASPQGFGIEDKGTEALVTKKVQWEIGAKKHIWFMKTWGKNQNRGGITSNKIIAVASQKGDNWKLRS